METNSSGKQAQAGDVDAQPNPPTPKSAMPPHFQYLTNVATQFSTEIRQLKQDLQEAKQSLAVKETEVENLQQQLNQRKTEADLEKDVKEIKKMLALERKLRVETEEKFKRFKEQVTQIFAEYQQVTAVLKAHTDDDKTVVLPQQQVFQGLKTRLETKWLECTENQTRLKKEVVRVSGLVAHLNVLVTARPKIQRKLMSAVPKTPVITKVVTAPPQPLPTITPETSPPPPPRASVLLRSPQHAEDTTKSSLLGYFCICGTEYTTRANLRIHIMTMTDQGKFSCTKCPQTFVQYYMLRRHMQDKHGVVTPKGTYKVGCADCGQLFASRVVLREHRKLAHATASRTPDAPIKDEIKTVERAVSPVKRRRPPSASPAKTSHKKDTKVWTEDKGEGENVQKKHGLDPEDPLHCLCGFRSNNKYNISKHVTYHTTDKHFKCSFCPGKFINTTYLKQHLQRKHKNARVDLNQLRMGCSKCGETFQNRRAFQIHNMEVHYGVSSFFRGNKPTKGRMAKKVIRSRKRLGRVETSHFARGAVKKAHHFLESNTKKKFECSLCDSTFGALHQLLRHRKSVHKVVQHKFQIGCKDCGISFDSRTDHTRHRIDVHKSAIGRKSKTNQTSVKVEHVSPNRDDSSPERDLTFDAPVPIPIIVELEDGEEMDYETYEAQYMQQPGPSYRQKEEARDEVEEGEDEQEEETDEEEEEGEVRPFQAHAVAGYTEGIGHFCVCGTIFNEKKNLHSHIRRKTQEWNFECNICHKQFFYNATLKRHMLLTHKQTNIYRKEPGIGCVHCGATFPTWNALRQHQSFAHDNQETAERIRSPSVPRKTSTSPPKKIKPKVSPPPQQQQTQQVVPPEMEHGIDHARAHAGSYCICGKLCTSEKALHAHIRYATTEKKEACHLCPMKFITPSYLKQHLQRTHKESGAHVKTKRLGHCRRCGRNFRTTVNLFRHMKLAHGLVRGIKPKRVAEGTSEETTSAQLSTPTTSTVVHRAVPHRGGGGKCTCGKTYHSLGGLRKHIRLIKTGKVFNCDHCSKIFGEYSALRRHVATHGVQLEDGHACGVCGDLFDSHRDVLQHRIQKHGKLR